MDVLFNQEINKIKIEELQTNTKPKPIIFTIEDQFEDLDTMKGGVKFEIEGGGKAIQTSFIRKNEETFFEFLNEFTASPAKIDSKRPSMMLSDQAQSSSVPRVIRHRKSIRSPLLINPRDLNKQRELEEV